MRQLLCILSMTLTAVSMSLADGQVQVRYRPFSGPMSLTVSQDIEVPKAKEKPIATRRFSFDLTLAANSNAVDITIEKAKASYTAHGMKERLGTRHLTGKSFPLSIDQDGRKLIETAAAEAPRIDLGWMVEGGFSVAGLVADLVPVLPEEQVAVGFSWSTKRQVRSLEGWAWGIGSLNSRHRVIAVDQQEGRTVVSVESKAEAQLGSVEGQRGYRGHLKRTLRWTFDTTEGRLLSISMDQESEGDGDLPQGEMRLRQRTRVELGPVS